MADPYRCSRCDSAVFTVYTDDYDELGMVVVVCNGSSECENQASAKSLTGAFQAISQGEKKEEGNGSKQA